MAYGKVEEYLAEGKWNSGAFHEASFKNPFVAALNQITGLSADIVQDMVQKKTFIAPGVPGPKIGHRRWN